jgi:Ca-activated chloride channel homolog
MLRLNCVATALALALACAVHIAGQSVTLRADKDLVLVPVSVIDHKDRPVIGLEQKNFRIFDDRSEQSIESISMVDEPVAVGLVFDTSRSIGRQLRFSRLAAKTFLDSSNPEDEFLLVEFNDRPVLSVPLTNDPNLIPTRLDATEAKGSTALLDAISLGLREIKKSKLSRKALLVISDGGDNHSRFRPGEIERLVRESGVLIYAAGIYNGDAAGRDLLSRISEQSGGRAYSVSEKDLPAMAQEISVQLRNQYVLAFSPQSPRRDGRYHALEVHMVRTRGLPPLLASWRLGYYAISE